LRVRFLPLALGGRKWTKSLKEEKVLKYKKKEETTAAV
jgi:hypothetical protein